VQSRRLILSIWLTLGVAFGLYFSFPVFYVALLEEFGWSRGLAAGAFSLSAIVQGLLSPLVGALVDRVGPRRVMLGGGVLLGVSYLLGSWITTLWHLYLVTGVLAAAGACAVGWVPCAALLSRWFARRQGSVMGLAFSGMGVGILVLGPLAQWLITNHGWRQAYFLIGAGTIAALLPLAWFGIRDRPPTPVAPSAGSERAAVPLSAPAGSRGIDLRGALATRAFWALFLAYLFTPLAVFPVVTHQVAFAVDQGWPASSWRASSASPASCRWWAASSSASPPTESAARSPPASPMPAPRSARWRCSRWSAGTTRRRSTSTRCSSAPASGRAGPSSPPWRPSSSRGASSGASTAR